MQSIMTTIGMGTLCVALTSPAAHAQLAEYYIGIDSRSTPFNATVGNGGGAYADNPNQNRLVLLYQHGNHYHGIGTYNYTGPVSSPTLNDTNANNRLPETYTGQTPLALTAGSGAFAGKLVSGGTPGVDYSNLEIRNHHSLNQSGASPAELTLFNSSSNRWNGLFDDAHIHLEVISLTTGLNMSLSSPLTTIGVDSDVHVGDGDEVFSFTPVFWTEGNAALGTYTAELKLTDESGSFGESGRFFVDFQVVPEPTSAAILAGLSGLAMIRRHRKA